MEKAKLPVIFSIKAHESIFQIKLYIAIRGNPDRSGKFADKLYDFGYSLGASSFAYPICRHPKFAKRKMRCAIFQKTYIFVYKKVKQSIVIYNIIHGNMNPVSFSA